jgi:hypothetical protein
MTKQTGFMRGLLVLLIVLAVAVVAYGILTAPDRRTPGEKIGDAVGELSNGLDKAGRQLEDRTPAEKLGDAAKDARDEIKDSVNR